MNDIHIKWPKIQQLKHVKRYLNDWGHGEPITFRPKVKLHGTNAAIRVVAKDSVVRVTAQSRNRDLTPEDDNCGFAAFVESTTDVIFKDVAIEDVRMTIFGEWCGRGIMKGTALNQLPDRYFAIFAVEYSVGEGSRVITSPRALHAILQGLLATDPRVFILPWAGPEFTVNPLSPESWNSFGEQVNAMTDVVDKLDPWVMQTFGVIGPGEGLVYYPVNGSGHIEDFAKRAFKAKGMTHRVEGSKARPSKAATMDPEVLASIQAFAEHFVTDGRCEQALAELDITRGDRPRTGDFLGWVGKDVKEESQLELEANGLEWKQVSKAVAKAAQSWWFR